MKTALLTTVLTIAFLSAGAFANVKIEPARTGTAAGNITVIAKNQAWPVKGRIASDSCTLVRCIDI